MNFKQMTIFVAAGLLAASAVGCKESAEPAATNSNAAVVAPNSTRSEAKVLKADEPGPDNSKITVRQQESGDTVTIRKWDAGPVRKLTRREQNGETKVVRVVTREGTVYRVEDKDTVEHALDWTGQQIADSAKKVGKAVDAVADEVGDKAEDVKDETVEGAKKVGSEVGDKAEDVKDQTVKGAKKVGSEVGDKAEDVKDQTVKGAKKVGGALKP
jgi:gas vesicle protein